MNLEKRFWIYNPKQEVVESRCEYEFKAREKLEQYAHINNGHEFILLEVIAVAKEPSHVEWTELKPKPLHDTTYNTCKNESGVVTPNSNMGPGIWTWY